MPDTQAWRQGVSRAKRIRKAKMAMRKRRRIERAVRRHALSVLGISPRDQTIKKYCPTGWLVSWAIQYAAPRCNIEIKGIK